MLNGVGALFERSLMRTIAMSREGEKSSCALKRATAGEMESPFCERTGAFEQLLLIQSYNHNRMTLPLL